MPTLTLPQALQLAFQHHQAGRLAQAEKLYRQILARQPDHADALQHLGVIAGQVGRTNLAEARQDPTHPVQTSGNPQTM